MVTQKEGIPEGWEGMDCGPKSMELFRETVLASSTVIWNGPAGVFEFDNFSKGTKVRKIYKYVELHNCCLCSL